MATVNLRKTTEYIEGNSFKGMYFDTPTEIVIVGKQFTIARLTNYAMCPSYDAIVKYIEENGGTVREKAVKSSDYVIVTPLARGSSSLVYKEEKDKYEKAVEYCKTSSKPCIVRDVDFFIINDMFSKLAIDDKRRVVMEYNRSNPCFTEKTAKKVRAFVSSKGKSDPYLKTKDLKVLRINESKN